MPEKSASQGQKEKWAGEVMGYSIFYPYRGMDVKFHGLVKSKNFQRSTAKSPKFQGVGNILQQNS